MIHRIAALLLALGWSTAALAQVTGGGSGAPGGSNLQLQYNNNGALGGYTVGTGLLVTGGALTATGAVTLATNHIFVGVGGIATDVVCSGDVACASTGALTVGSIGGKSVSLANSLTISGNFAPTLTFTATTNSTFPAGTHSLAPLDSPSFTDTPLAPTAAVGTNTTQLATAAFVKTAIDNAVAGVNPAVAVQAATTAAGNTSGLTYNNGAAGIGATLTGSINTAITWDGYTFTATGQRGLVKNDTQSPSGAFNGVYSMTQVQTVGLPPILTRALDYNQPSDINNTGAIPVINGTVNGTTSWVITSSVTTVGTDPLTFAQFTQNPAAVAITGGTAAGLTGLGIRDTSAAFDVTLAAVSSTALNAGRILTLDTKNVAHTLAFSATANTITFPNTASYTLIGSQDANTVSLGMVAQSAANTVVGNATGSTANNTALPMTGCATGASAVSYATNTGFGCNTAITATTNANLTGPVTSSGNATSMAAGVITDWIGTTAGSANAYTIASPTPAAPAFTLTDQYKVRAKVSFTNTAAATLNVASTGATAINTNTSSGLASLKGGEIVSTLEYDFTYNSTCACFVVMNTASGAVSAGTSQTVTAAQWGAWTWFNTTTASQTLTLPAVSTLSDNGGIAISAIGVNVTLTANAADAINGGAAGGSVTIMAGNTAFITRSSATNIAAAPLGTLVAAPGTTHTMTGPREIYACTGTCTVTVPVPVAGYQFCVMNDNNVATAITLAALGSSAMYENTARTAYGTAGTGTLVATAVAANAVCLVGRDATHYWTTSSTGSWTAN